MAEQVATEIHAPTKSQGRNEEDLLPLCVDLDGTLIRTDLLYESVVALIRKNVLFIFALPFWLIRGRAYLKRQIAQRVSLQFDLLPYNDAVIDHIREEKAAGRRLILATASDQIYADKVAEYLGIFDEVHGSDGERNLKGSSKQQYLTEQYDRYEYIGDSRSDLPLWKEAQGAYLVTQSQSLVETVRKTTPVRATFPGKQFRVKTLLRSLRVHQWVKNLLIFVPILMAHKLTDLPLLLQAVMSFVSFSFCASGVYLMNDLFDLESDRAHRTKCKRPLAHGDFSLPFGATLSLLLFLLSLTISLTLPSAFISVLAGYFVLTSAYSLGLKRVAVLDIVLLASLYTVRIFAGGMAVDVPVSKWLLAFSLFFFFSLACMKRFSELYSVRKQNLSHAKGRGYHAQDLEQIASFGSASGYLAILVLALYINSTEVAKLYTHASVLWLLCPVFLYWITRIWLLAHRGEVHEDPIVFAIRDKTSYLVGLISVILLFLAR